MVGGEGDLSEQRGAWSQEGIVGVFVPEGRYMASNPVKKLGWAGLLGPRTQSWGDLHVVDE